MNPLASADWPATSFAGYFGILPTPFLPDDAIDERSMIRQVEFCRRARMHGIVWPQLGSEFFTLSDEERMQTSRLILDAAQGKIPVVIGVQGPATAMAVKLARHAAENGAAAVIALPPYLGAVSLETVQAYFLAVAGAVEIPVLIQNSGGAWGPALSPSWVLQLASEQPRICGVKDEVMPVPQRLAEYAQPGVLRGIFSGNAGRDCFNEIARGATGSMGAPQFGDLLAAIYRLLGAGQINEARLLYEKLLPLWNLEPAYGGIPFVKSLLVRRGIFTSAKMRHQPASATDLDPGQEREIDYWWQKLQPFFTA